MKQLALEVVARTLDQGQIRLLTEEFDRADNTNNGEVRGRHLADALGAIQFLRLVGENPTCSVPAS